MTVLSTEEQRFQSIQERLVYDPYLPLEDAYYAVEVYPCDDGLIFQAINPYGDVVAITRIEFLFDDVELDLTEFLLETVSESLEASLKFQGRLVVMVYGD